MMRFVIAAGSPSRHRHAAPPSPQGIPNSQLAVLPGTTHVTLMAKGSCCALEVVMA